MRLTRPSRYLLILLALPVLLYVLYVVAVSAILNTPIFGLMTGMTDQAETHLRFSRAYSIIPGKIHVGRIVFALRDPGVEIDLTLRGAGIELELEKLLDKQLRIHALDVSGVHVAIRTKQPPKGPKRVEITREEEIFRQQNRWQLWITGIDLRDFEGIEFGRQKMTGDLRIQGGFFLQPGTVAEIFPTSFTIREGSFSGDIDKISLDLLANFERFSGPRTSGSEVFKYLNADISGTAVAQSLDLLNVTLRRLQGYVFGKTEATNLGVAVKVVRGEIQPGSHFRAKKTEIRFDSPTFQFIGKGNANWEVGKVADESDLRFEIADAKTQIRLSERQTLKGSIKKVGAHARLRGLSLANPFTGLAGRIEVANGRVAVDGDLAIAARIRGELTAIAGDVPKSWIPKSQSRLKIWIDRSRIPIPDMGKIEGNGLIAISVRPIDFRTAEAELPSLQFDYSGKIQDKYPFGFRWRSSRSIRRFPTDGKQVGNFEGQGLLEFSQVNNVLSFLSDTKKLPKLAAVALNATEMSAAVEWDFTESEKWIRAKEVDSNGIWKGWGAIIFTDQETRGAFEGRVAGIPIGIGIGEPNVRFKLLPNKTWYDARTPTEPADAP